MQGVTGKRVLRKTNAKARSQIYLKFSRRVSGHASHQNWGLPKWVFPNGCFAEVPQHTVIYIRTLFYKIDQWTNKAFKGFAANARCYLNASRALQSNFSSNISWPTKPMQASLKAPRHETQAGLTHRGKCGDDSCGCDLGNRMLARLTTRVCADVGHNIVYGHQP